MPTAIPTKIFREFDDAAQWQAAITSSRLS
jgi:hypothetical protein